MSAPGPAGAPGGALAASLGMSSAQFTQVAQTYGYVAFWIVTSAGVILYNKWILTVWGFNYPLTLTMWHMFFCSAVSAALVRARTLAAERAARCAAAPRRRCAARRGCEHGAQRLLRRQRRRGRRGARWAPGRAHF
jgi:hypothetical protein